MVQVIKSVLYPLSLESAGCCDAHRDAEALFSGLVQRDVCARRGDRDDGRTLRTHVQGAVPHLRLPGSTSKGPCLTSDYQDACPRDRASPPTTRSAAGPTCCTTSTASAPAAATASSPSLIPSCTICIRARKTSSPTWSRNTSARKVQLLYLPFR